MRASISDQIHCVAISISPDASGALDLSNGQKEAIAKGSKFFFDTKGTGDSFLLFSLLEDYGRQLNVPMSSIHVFSTPANYEVGALFDSIGVQRHLILDNFGLGAIRPYFGDPVQDFVLDPHITAVPGCQRLNAMTVLPGVTDQKIMSYLLGRRFNLKRTIPMIHETAQAKVWRDKLGRDKKNVLLVWRSNSMASINLQIWSAIARALTEEGFRVYQNGREGHNDPVIEGAEPFQLDVMSTLAVLDAFDLVLGCQCGFFSIMLEVSRRNNLMLILDRLVPHYRDHLTGFCDDNWPFFYPERFLDSPHNILTYELTDVLERDVEAIRTKSRLFGPSPFKISRLRALPIAMSAGEVIDRLTILQIKMEKFDGQKKIDSMIEYERLLKVAQISFDMSNIESQIEELYQLNLQAWTLNDDIYEASPDDRGNQEKMAALGQKIFEASNINKERIAVKNIISRIVSDDEVIENKTFN